MFANPSSHFVSCKNRLQCSQLATLPARHTKPVALLPVSDYLATNTSFDGPVFNFDDEIDCQSGCIARVVAAKIVSCKISPQLSSSHLPMEQKFDQSTLQPRSTQCILCLLVLRLFFPLLLLRRPSSTLNRRIATRGASVASQNS